MNLIMTLLAALHCCRRIFVWRSGAGRQSAGRSAGTKTATNDPDYTAKACLQGFLRNKPEALPKSEGGLGQGDRSQCKNRPGKLLVHFQNICRAWNKCMLQYATRCNLLQMRCHFRFRFHLLSGRMILCLCRNADSVELIVISVHWRWGGGERCRPPTENMLWLRTKKL